MLENSSEMTGEYFTEIITDMCIDLDNFEYILDSNHINNDEFINSIHDKFIEIGEKDAKNMNRIMDIENMDEENVNMYRDMIINMRYNNIPDEININKYWMKGYNNYIKNIE